jgi:NAD(P)H dehydrogenase (quinone)
MTTYAVTGVTGHLGRLVVAELLARGVPAADVVGLARSLAKAADLGVAVRRADYSDPATLVAAQDGVDVLLLVSGSEVGRRIAQHTAVIDAAKSAGVGRVAYTSIANADRNAGPLTPEHEATEEALRASGLPFTILRDNWYLENYTAQLPSTWRRARCWDWTVTPGSARPPAPTSPARSPRHCSRTAPRGRPSSWRARRSRWPASPRRSRT